jgi:hypothetical protein
MAKEFSEWEGSLPESEDAYHVAGDGYLRLINFGVNHPELQPQHKPIIETKLIPFMLSATKSLGPGEYHLRCRGTASATGTFDNNARLSDGRAMNAANYAKEAFEKQASKYPHVASCKIIVGIKDVIAGADGDAEDDVRHRHLAPQEIEAKQAHFRSAQFFLNARKLHGKGAAIFQIRELYLFNFKSKAEPLPEALQRIQQAIAAAPVLKFFLSRTPLIKGILAKISDFSTTVSNALGPEGKIAIIMIKFMIPDEIDACYEIKNSENNHALYRFNGTGNKTSTGILDILSLLAEAVSAMKGAVKAISTIAGLPGKADKSVQFIEKYITDLHKDAVDFARTFGPGFATMVDQFLTLTENGVTAKALFAPASGWVPFMWHDRSAKHLLTDPDGKSARQNTFGAAFNQVVDIEFGGPVPNNWSDWQAEAKIKRNIVDLLAIETAGGSFYLLKANYLMDLTVGPTEIVKDN